MSRLPPPSPTPLAPVWDSQALGELEALDPDGKRGLVLRVLRTYHASLLRLLGQLQRAGTANDLVAVAQVAHTLKSSSASVGAAELSQHCAEVEHRIREHAIEGLEAQISRMQVAGEQAAQAVAELIRRRTQDRP